MKSRLECQVGYAIKPHIHPTRYIRNLPDAKGMIVPWWKQMIALEVSNVVAAKLKGSSPRG